MRDLWKHEASGATLSREIAQPHVSTFAECFTDWAPYDVCDSKRKHQFEPATITGQNVAGNLFKNVKDIFQGKPRQIKHSDETMKIGPYLNMTGPDNEHRSMSVRCADWVLSRIRERTIIIGGESMHFEIVVHDNGWALVIAQHGQICGSVWLAYIKVDSIPL